MVDQQFGFAANSNAMAAQSSLKTKLNQLEVKISMIFYSISNQLFII